MNSRFFGKRKPYNKYAVLLNQKRLIEKHFNYLSCNICNYVLICTGGIQPSNCKNEYRIKIEYVVGKEPKTTILSPEIDPSPHIHMYQDHSLCLHYTPDMKWNEKTKIYLFTIPWISEWIIFYELYISNGGKWLGKESPYHIREHEKNVNKDTN